MSKHVSLCWPCVQVIPCEWLKLFNTQEVNQLLGGGENAALDVTDMAAHAQYSGGYNKNHPTIKIFWKVWVQMSNVTYMAAHAQYNRGTIGTATLSRSFGRYGFVCFRLLP